MREGRLRWYEHVMRRDQEYVGRAMEMELLGKRKRGRPKRRFLDVVKKDMGKVGARERRTLKTGHFGETLYVLATPDQRERPKKNIQLRLELGLCQTTFKNYCNKLLH